MLYTVAGLSAQAFSGVSVVFGMTLTASSIKFVRCLSQPAARDAAAGDGSRAALPVDIIGGSCRRCSPLPNIFSPHHGDCDLFSGFCGLRAFVAGTSPPVKVGTCSVTTSLASVTQSCRSVALSSSTC